MADHSYLTVAEFERWAKQIADSLERVENGQRYANGKVADNTAVIAVMLKRIEKIEREDQAIEDTVRDIRDMGCSQLRQHHTSLLLRRQQSPGEEDAYQRLMTHPQDWPRRMKVAAGATVAVALLPAVQDVAKMFYAFFLWLHSTLR